LTAEEHDKTVIIKLYAIMLLYYSIFLFFLNIFLIGRELEGAIPAMNFLSTVCLTEIYGRFRRGGKKKLQLMHLRLHLTAFKRGSRKKDSEMQMREKPIDCIIYGRRAENTDVITYFLPPARKLLLSPSPTISH